MSSGSGSLALKTWHLWFPKKLQMQSVKLRYNV